jgi:hypothetical protein
MATTRVIGRAARECVLRGTCDASPEIVYDTLTDLTTHLEWAGRRQRRSFRLISLDGPSPAVAGSGFVSVGTIPMSRSRWQNRNRVTIAERPQTVEIVTDARATWRKRKPTDAVYRHRYEIEPLEGGCRVVYALEEVQITNPPVRMSFPPVRSLSYRVMIPFFCARGLKNLLRMSEQKSRDGASASSS